MRHIDSGGGDLGNMETYRYILPNLVTAGRLVLAGIFPFCDQKYWLTIILAAFDYWRLFQSEVQRQHTGM